MSELTEFLRFVTNAGAAVIPWLLVSLATLLVVKSWPHFAEYIAARTEAQHEVAELKRKLSETDYISSKTIESIIGSKDVVSLLSALKRIGDEYAEMLKLREEWRESINELEGGE